MGIAVDANAHYVYVSNSTLNTISGFAVSLNGSLTPVPGSPFVAGGSAPRGLTIDPRGKVLYGANAKSSTVSVYEIDAETGTLTNWGSVVAGEFPVAIAINPEGKYLYALNRSCFNLSCFAIDGVTGILSSLPNGPSFGSTLLNSISVDSLGKRVYTTGSNVVVAYTLFGNNGRLKLLPGSPFGDVSGASSLAVDLSDSFLYVSNSNDSSVSGFAIDKAKGSLAPLSGSPFGAGTEPTSVAVVNSFE